MALPGEVTVRRIPNSTYGALHVETSGASLIWKPLLAGNHNGWSELAAYRISQRLGLPHVPPALVLVVGERPGTASQFISGAFSPHDLQFDPENRKAARSFLMSRAFVDQVVSMFVFDAIIGNKDRHAGNWLVDSKSRKIWWIDHGSVRWAGSEKILLDAYKKLGITLKSLGISQKNVSQVLCAVREGLEHFSAERLEGWRDITEGEWAEMFQDLPEQSNHFHRDQARDHSWDALQALLREGGVKVSEAGFQRVYGKIERWRPGGQLPTDAIS